MATLVRTQPRAATWGVAVSALFVASLLVGVLFTGSVYSSPFIDDSEIARYYNENVGALRWIALFQFVSALALLMFTSVVATRVRGFAIAGGYLAAALLALNGLVQWVLTYAGVVADPAVRRGFHLFFFGLGGFAHVAACGLLVAGICMAGVLPKLLTRVGLVIAALAVLSLLTFVNETATLLIPVGRFSTLAWLVAVGYALR
jgi:hypothetical protein